jgi:hypothetical protein
LANKVSDSVLIFFHLFAVVRILSFTLPWFPWIFYPLHEKQIHLHTRHSIPCFRPCNRMLFAAFWLSTRATFRPCDIFHIFRRSTHENPPLQLPSADSQQLLGSYEDRASIAHFRCKSCILGGVYVHGKSLVLYIFAE